MNNSSNSNCDNNKFTVFTLKLILETNDAFSEQLEMQQYVKHDQMKDNENTETEPSYIDSSEYDNKSISKGNIDNEASYAPQNCFNASLEKFRSDQYVTDNIVDNNGF